jgi:hypothetical protein
MHSVLNGPVVVGVLLVGLAGALFQFSDQGPGTIFALTALGFVVMGYGVFFHNSDDKKSSGKISRHWDE